MATERLLIKVCGMTQGDNVRAVEATGIDLMGFIFYPRSPRYVHTKPDYLPRCSRVGVFVDADTDDILGRIDEYGLNYVQLHGHESPDRCRALRAQPVRLIKALSLRNKADAQAARAYDGLVDLLLFDTPTPAYGGSGQTFDWSLLSHYDGPTPFLLSGGIGPDSIAALHALRHPRWVGIDLNSRFETEPGRKDARRIATFVEQVNTSNTAVGATLRGRPVQRRMATTDGQSHGNDG